VSRARRSRYAGNRGKGAAMSIAVGAAPSGDEITVRGDVPKTSRRSLPMPVAVAGAVSLAIFTLAAVLLWAMSILLGIL
jgi:hypothetical protein